MEESNAENVISEINEFLDSIMWSNRALDNLLDQMEKKDFLTANDRSVLQKIYQALGIKTWKKDIRDPESKTALLYWMGREELTWGCEP